MRRAFHVVPTVVVGNLFSVHESDDFGVSALVVDGEGEGSLPVFDPGERPATDSAEDVNRLCGDFLNGDFHALRLLGGLTGAAFQDDEIASVRTTSGVDDVEGNFADLQGAVLHELEGIGQGFFAGEEAEASVDRGGL